ncbi:MAG: DNA-binding protein [Desulfobacteraceae bacterium 4572_130]|nr:MAG: DNA-binding protein [Desulfobacteraceae bacterium 4572_130]
MNKSDLINEVAKVLGTKKNAKLAVDCVFQSITKTLKKNEECRFVGFGTFKIVRRKQRIGINPQTGKKIQIKAKNAPKFIAGKALKDAVK